MENRGKSFVKSPMIVWVGVTWALVSALLLAKNWADIQAMDLQGPDDVLRLVQVRDLLGGQSWFDLTQYRTDAPRGVPMHWSRIVDAPLALVILALTPLFGTAGAEMAAVVVVPLLTLAAAIFLVARLAWRVFGQEAAIMAMLIVAVASHVLIQLSPMRIDHHGWQIVCALAAMNGLVANSARTGGRIIGAALAVWLSISIEGLPLAAAIFAVLALRWLRNRDDKQWLVSAIQSLFVTSAALFLLTRGLGDLRGYCDAISPFHIFMFGWGALVLTIISMKEPKSLAMLLAGFALAGAGAIAIMLLSAPQCAGGGFAELDPLVARYWHANVLEGMPVWRQDEPELIVLFLSAPLFGLYSIARLVASSQGAQRRFWIDYGIILAAALVIAVLVARASIVASVLAAPPFAWQFSQWLAKLRTLNSPVRRVLGMALLACALLPVLPMILANKVLPDHAVQSVGSASDEGDGSLSQCKIDGAMQVLSQYPKAEIFAPLDFGPSILQTHHGVVATGHHRASEAMRVVIETSLGSTQNAHDVLRQRGTGFVVVCPDLGETGLFMKEAPDGFIADLMNDKVPDWLGPLPVGAGTNMKLWRVKPE